VPRWIAIIVAIVGSALYLPTLASGPLWLDPSEFIAGAVSMGIVHPPGHPTYMMLAKLASFLPLGGLAFRIHLLSAVFGVAAGGISASITYHVSRQLFPDQSSWIAHASSLLAGIGLLVTRACWEQSVRAEVYTLNLFSTLVLIWLAVHWLRNGRVTTVIVFMAVTGLALGNHHYLVFFAVLAPLCVLFSRPDGRKLFLQPVALYAVIIGVAALASYAYIPIRAAGWPVIDWGHPTTLARFLDTLTAATFQGALEPAARQAGFGDNLLYATAITISQMGVASIAFTIIGFLGVLRSGPRYGALLVGTYLTTLITKSLLFIDAANPDDHGYFALAVAMCAVGQGLSIPVICQAATAQKLRSGLALVLFFGALIGLGNVALAGSYDQSSDTSAEAFTDSIFESVPSDAVLAVEYYGLFFNGWYAQLVEGRRPDVALVQQTFDVNRYGGEWYVRSLAHHYPDLTPVADAVLEKGEFPVNALLALERKVFVQPSLGEVPNSMYMSTVGLVREFTWEPRTGASPHTVCGQIWHRILSVAAMYGAPRGEALKVIHWFSYLELVTALRQGQGQLARSIVKRWASTTPLGPPGEVIALVEQLEAAELDVIHASAFSMPFAQLRLDFVKGELAKLDYIALLSHSTKER
jgi:hypothetical protein